MTKSLAFIPLQYVTQHADTISTGEYFKLFALGVVGSGETKEPIHLWKLVFRYSDVSVEKIQDVVGVAPYDVFDPVFRGDVLMILPKFPTFVEEFAGGVSVLELMEIHPCLGEGVSYRYYERVQYY